MSNGGIERLKFVTAVTLYGTVGLFLRYVNLPSELAALCRGAIGCAFILLFVYLRGGRPDGAAIRANLKWLLLSGVCLGLNWVFLFASYMKTTVAVASLCNYTAPILVILVAPALLRERPDRRKIPCVAAAIAGLLLVSGFWNGDVGGTAGILLGLAGALCFACLVICNRKLRDISALDRSIVQLGVSAATILPYVLIHNRGTAIHLDTRAILILAMLGVVHTGFAYCLYFSGLGSLPVQTVAILGYLEPVVSVLCSTLFLHERLSPLGWVGAALILGAAVASELIPAQEDQKQNIDSTL